MKFTVMEKEQGVEVSGLMFPHAVDAKLSVAQMFLACR